jgi:hypothetical protein
MTTPKHVIEPPTSEPLDDSKPDLHCPLCDYNLRGLTEPRCPECGHAFDWDELRFRRDCVHPYLFEHHPERPVGAFLRTLVVGGLRPMKFWRTLRPIHDTRRRRIIAYAVCTALLAVSVTLVTCVVTAVWLSDLFESHLVDTGSALEALWMCVRALAPPRAVLCLLAWPWATLAVFSIFFVSLHRAKVRYDHVLRCAVYSADAVVWVAPFLVLVLLAPRPRRYVGFDWEDLAVTAVVTVGLLWMALRLVVASKRYLNFRQSVIIALLTQVIVLGPMGIYWAACWVFWQIMRQ